MQELIGALSLASIYVLFALGMSLTWGTIDILNFAHGSIFMFSAFTAYLVLQSTSLSFLVVLLIGVVVGAAMSDRTMSGSPPNASISFAGASSSRKSSSSTSAPGTGSMPR